MKFITKIVIISIIFKITVSYMPHCDHSIIEPHVVVHHHGHYLNHIADHVHVGDRTIHGKMTNISPSAIRVISPQIGIYQFKFKFLLYPLLVTLM